MENEVNNSADVSRQGSGSVIGLVILIIILAFGGVYLYNRSKNAPVNDTTVQEDMVNDGTMPTGDTGTSVDASMSSEQNMQSSDDLNSIDQDLNSTDVNSLDAGL